MGRIVVIEDDPHIAEVLRDLLEGTGHAVTVATSVEELPPPDSYDAVITDLLAVPAYETGRARAWLDTLRARYRGARMLLVTGHSEAADDGPETLGIDAVVRKPFRIDQIESLVAGLLQAS